MLGLRARASRNPISAISSPLNARSTLDNSTAASQSPLSCNLWTTCTLIRAQLFTLFTTFTCSNYPLLPRFKSNTTTLALTTTVASTRASTSTTTTALTFEPAATNHALRPLLPLPFTIGRFAHACIKTTTTTVQAKAKAAVRATVRTSSPTHFFVRVSTYLTANLIVLHLRLLRLLLHPLFLRDAFLGRLFPNTIPSTSPPTRRPIQSLPSLSTSPLSFLPLPLKEALATSTSLAQALLQTPRQPKAPFSTVPHAFANPRITTLSQQPTYPGASPVLQTPVAAHAAALPQAHTPSLLRQYDPKEYFLQSPFRNRAASSAARRLPHLSAARLWNPTNSTPRLPDKPALRKRRPSTPPPPAVPLSHPTLDPLSVDPADPLGIGASDYPLLTLPEQRQTRHSTSNRNSLQIDRSGSGAEHRISLPPSVRHSYDGRRSADPSPTFLDPDARPADEEEEAPAEPSAETRVTGLRKRGQSISDPVIRDFAITLNDKGKGKASMEPGAENQGRGVSKDLERGPDVLPRHSNVSAGDGMGIGSAISSSNSSIMGEELPPDLGEEWGPQHPCFPHMNPHVPLDSPEYHNTRIIRIRRDWLIEGDLAPTFSNLYPEILDPAGLSEQEFRRIVDKLNGELIPIFSPYNWRNVVDSMLGLVTGWLWDDLGFTGVKARLKRLERWIDQWNNEMEKTIGNEDSSMAPRIISLRKTGYMTLDIQIPDPEIAPAPSTPGGSRSGSLPMEPATAVMAS
ncbi:hypothetical protein CMEL01_13945 [Colletotrichum melonis]|uniref:Ras modification protein ERF4 n=1 Tax=Colletotrichum melonis TaxID=1209925 RepID=A0AAI9UQH3_9PEZI|nr:hypothetical protein CMEL01_13945 [Colletotrichum melonis]